MPITYYDLTSSIEVVEPGSSGGVYPATGNVSDCVLLSGWSENPNQDEPLLRVAPDDPSYLIPTFAQLRFTPPNLHGLTPEQVKVRFSMDVSWDGLIRDAIASPGHISEYFYFQMETYNTYGPFQFVNFGRYEAQAQAGPPPMSLLLETLSQNYNAETDTYFHDAHNVAILTNNGSFAVGSQRFEGFGYYTGEEGQGLPVGLFEDVDHQSIVMTFYLYMGFKDLIEPSVEFSWNISNLSVIMEVGSEEAPPSDYPYVPIAGQCDTIDHVYYGAEAVFETNDAWVVNWTKTTVPEGLRWDAEVTVLENLLHDTFVVLGGTIASDGGFGGSSGPPPSSGSPTSYAFSPQITNVSGVVLNDISMYPDNSAASVSVADNGTFTSGATFTLSFTVPDEFETHLVMAIFGTLDNLPSEMGLSFNVQFEDVFVIAWTKNCGNPPKFRVTWLEPGTKVYERGVDRGVIYMDDGRVVPWNGLTGVDEDLGRVSDSVYFDGSKLSEVVSPEGFSASVSAISYPKQLEEVYGNKPLRRGFYLGGQTPKTFGFSYRTRVGNELNEVAGYKIHIIYNVLASPDNRSYETISDEPNVTEFGWNFKTTPEPISGYRPSAYLVLDSTRVTPSLLAEIENILYGTLTDPPRLPPLQELLTIINDFNNFINIVDNGDGTWEANTLVDGVINDLGDGVFEIRYATIQETSSTSYLISPTPDPPA
jgi:hypothetical protein